MRSHWFLAAAFAAFSSLALGQSFEASVGGGQTLIPGKNANIGTVNADPASGTYSMTDGLRITARMALNTGRFTGHEFGYAYSRTKLQAPASTATVIGANGQPTQ